jgi:NTP pyrophosphatase (non-canonical NTP hydrolase)
MVNTKLNPEDKQTVSTFGLLQSALIWQYKLSNTCGVNVLEKMQALKSTLSQMVVEAAEAFAPWVTETKPWKPQYPDLAATDEEVIDVLHYVLTWANLREWTAEELIFRYRAKNLRNFERVNEKISAMDGKN